MTRQHPRTRAIGEAILDIAWRVTDAYDHLTRELQLCDGHTAGAGETHVTMTDGSTTETIALRRVALSMDRDRLTEAVANVEHAQRLLAIACSTALRQRAPEIVQTVRCRDNQIGKEGAVEWGRPWCEDLPVKAGLCTACYHRERRWRQAHGYTLRDVEAAR